MIMVACRAADIIGDRLTSHGCDWHVQSRL
jgi:hypothetical protein